MAQPQYIVRCRFNKELVQANTLDVSWKKIYNTRRLRGGFGYVSDDTGKQDKTKIDIRVRDVIRDTGHRAAGTNWVEQIERKAADVKTVIRRLRDDEEAVLDNLDQEIMQADAQLKALRAQRAIALREAWTRAHVVRLTEVEALVKR